jgi:phosphoglycolate phosphatase
MLREIHAFRCYFFDWDGCVADTLPFWLEGYRLALRRRGLHAPDEVILRELFNDWAGPERFGVPDPGRFTDEVADEVAARSGQLRMNPHIAEVLRALRAAGRATALLTASRRRLVKPVLEAHGLAGLLDLVLTVEDVRAYKPDPEVVHRALERFGVQPEEAVLVGDSDKDIQAARGAGAAVALYLPEHNRAYYDVEHLLSWKPEFVIDDFRRLLPPPRG